MRAEQFEFLTPYRGPLAVLGWTRGGHEFQVMLTEWPASLLSMLRADVLGPKAKAEAARLLKLRPVDLAAPGRSVAIAGRV